FDRLVRRCLAKDPAARWNSAADLEHQLREISEVAPHVATAAPTAGRARMQWIPWAVAALATGLGLFALLALYHKPPPEAQPAQAVRFTLPPPEGGEFSYRVDCPWMAVSPDGSRLAYLATDSKGVTSAWLRPLDASEARPIAGTEGAWSLFWSPDGRALGFFAGARMLRLDLAGGPPVPICDVPPGNGMTGTWGSDDILFGSIFGQQIFRVAAAGGTPVVAVASDTASGERRVRWPCFLPDGRRFLYLNHRLDNKDSLMLVTPGARRRAVMAVISKAQFTAPDWLTFVREGTLLGQRFDPRSGRLVGAPFAVADPVGYFLSTAGSSFATSARGTLAYQSSDNVSRLVWLDRGGHEVGTLGTPGSYYGLTLAADGRRVLTSRTQPGIGTDDVWSLDVARGTETRITSNPYSDFGALWHPDGHSVVYSLGQGTLHTLHRQDLETGMVERLLPPTGLQTAQQISPDGKTLLYIERTGRGALGLWTLPLAGGPPRRVFPPGFEVLEAEFSPDGRFIAFLSDESGRFELYVTPYPGPGQRVHVSNGGAQGVRWVRNGREILYLSDDRHLMSVSVRTSPALDLGVPVTLFECPGEGPWPDFDVTPDGQRILAIVPQTIADRLPLNVVVNWPAGVGK
ncbi:MAG: hypothetical protein ABIS67_14555, partial [Candidatus Eisenbacteria bacterium]